MDLTLSPESRMVQDAGQPLAEARRVRARTAHGDSAASAGAPVQQAPVVGTAPEPVADPPAVGGHDVRPARAGAPPMAAPEPSQPPDAPPGPFATGLCHCPWCPGACFATPGAFMTHVTRMHEGTLIDGPMLQILRGIERAVCSAEACRGIRRIGMRQCHRCNTAIGMRPLVLGDIIPGGRGVPLRERPVEPPASVGDTAGDAHGTEGDVVLPERFTERVRLLSSDTLVHIPSPCRVRMTKAATPCWEGMAARLPGWSALEEGRSRMILGGIPEGSHVDKEVAVRLDLWERRAFGELLNRLEMQAAMARQARGRRSRRRPGDGSASASQGGGGTAGPADVDEATRERSLKQSREGAYRKALGTVSSGATTIESSEARRWAVALHPPSAHSGDALATAPADAAAPPVMAAGADGTDDVRHPLRGVRFAALCGPGPSGTRPEHLAEIIGVKRRRIAARATRALAQVIDAIEAGRLCEEARWVTRSRSIYLTKKVGNEPRPIKCIEVLRSANAKRLMRQHAAGLRPTLLEMHQWGISLPGGAEALVHWRSTVEEAARDGLIEPIVIADLDMKNFFNSVEWPAIRESMRRHLEQATPVVEWEQRERGVTILPDGSEFLFDRGAEQGEPLGSVKASLPLGDARARVASSGVAAHVVDEWFIDDGQLVCAPRAFDPWLRAFDAEVARIGATRGQGEGVKSTARLVCRSNRAPEAAGWDTACVRSTCVVLPSNSAAKVLGVTVGDPAATRAAAAAVCAKVRAKREAISAVGHTATELVLTRRCGDVSTFTFQLRCHGDLLRDGPADEFDRDLRAGIEASLGGALLDTAWWQANVGVEGGGLGLRAAKEVALPAFIGSRIASRPMVASMFMHLESAGLASSALLLNMYDLRTRRALDAFAATLPAAVLREYWSIVDSAVAGAAARWERLVRGRAGPVEDNDAETADLSARHAGTAAAGLVLDAGAEDGEHPDFRGSVGGPPAQRSLSALVDRCVLAGLVEHFRNAGATVDADRLDDLAARGTSHSLLWALSPHQGPVIEEDAEFAEAVRVRLGSGGPPDVGVCGYCERHQLDSAGGHASCCAVGEATLGHNAVRDVVFAYAAEADPSADREVADLAPSHPRARPADVLTTAAIAGRVAALDVGVTSPAAAAGADAADAMFARKVAEREPIRAELEASNIEYRPIVWTCFGRPHAAAAAAVRAIARRVARKRGGAPPVVIERKITGAIAVCLARRAGRMSLACWPRSMREGASAGVARAFAHFDADVHSPGDVGAAATNATPAPTRTARTRGTPARPAEAGSL